MSRLLSFSIYNFVVEILNKKNKTMEKRIINPWQWQDQRSYVQAVEVKQADATLYISGQTAINADGQVSTGDMKSQLIQTIQNLEQVISEAGYGSENIVRLNIYTTSSAELFACFDIFQDWIAKHGIKQATTLFEVKSLFETLKVELEATVVR
jgi:enamine deaminase RidA (YjgF/YER057c/UK114 family)